MSHVDEVVALYRYDQNVSDQLYRRLIEDAQARDKDRYDDHEHHLRVYREFSTKV